MSGFQAFMTGFLGRTAEKIDERKDKASDYFDQAIERARTIGADSLRQRTDNYNAMMSVANNLIQQAGMPEELVMEIANSGPGALEQAYQFWETNAAAGKVVDANLWYDIYGAATEITAGSEMNLEDFMRQVNGLYGSNLAATEREGGDPFGAFIASGLGLNAMERAQEQLGEYDMGGGYSAADLLAMEARPSTTNPLGNTDFGGPNLAVAIPGQGVAPLNTEERLRLSDRFEEQVLEEQQRLFEEYMSGVGDGTADRNRESFEQEARENVAFRWASVSPEVLPQIGVFYDEQEGGGESPPPSEGGVTTEDLASAGIGASPEPVTAPEAPTVQEPTAFDPTQPDLTLEDGTIAQYVGTTPSGKLRYTLEDGSMVEGTKEEIDAIIASGGAQPVPQMTLGTLDPSKPLNDE